MTTEKMRVSASSVIRSVPDVSPTAMSWPRETGVDEDSICRSSSLLRILLPMLFRRALLAGAILWAAVIPLAALTAARPDGPPMAYGFALAVYSIGHLICHQLPARSFHLSGAALPVCARCTGIYAGAAVTAAFAWALAEPATATSGRARRLLFAALVPTALTLVYEWTAGT